jgi:hypothetical protein
MVLVSVKYHGPRLPRILTRRAGVKMACSAFSFTFMRGHEPTVAPPDLAKSIPPRDPHAITGSKFAESILNMVQREREHSILHQLLKGNMPAFLRKLVPVKLSHRLSPDQSLAATVFVMPEYLAIGSDSDFLRIPMNFHTAKAIAESFGFVLPTRKIVDAIYDASTYRFKPEPLPAGPKMTTTEYYRLHNAMIDKQSRSRDFPSAALVSGHKKDVVITNRLNMSPDRIAIYGWHRATNAPIQPLSLVHGAGYADYSHGIRLVGRLAVIDGKLVPVQDILRDSQLARVVSDEGAISVSPSAAV